MLLDGSEYGGRYGVQRRIDIEERNVSSREKHRGPRRYGTELQNSAYVNVFTAAASLMTLKSPFSKTTHTSYSFLYSFSSSLVFQLLFTLLLSYQLP